MNYIDIMGLIEKWNKQKIDCRSSSQFESDNVNLKGNKKNKNKIKTGRTRIHKHNSERSKKTKWTVKEMRHAKRNEKNEMLQNWTSFYFFYALEIYLYEQ